MHVCRSLGRVAHGSALLVCILSNRCQATLISCVFLGNSRWKINGWQLPPHSQNSFRWVAGSVRSVVSARTREVDLAAPRLLVFAKRGRRTVSTRWITKFLRDGSPSSARWIIPVKSGAGFHIPPLGCSSWVFGTGDTLALHTLGAKGGASRV